MGYRQWDYDLFGLVWPWECTVSKGCVGVAGDGAVRLADQVLGIQKLPDFPGDGEAESPAQFFLALCP